MNSSVLFEKWLPSRKNSLRQSELDSLLNLLPQPALLIDLENETLALANQRALQFTGYAPAGIAGLPIQALFPAVPGQPDLLDIDFETLAAPFRTSLKLHSGAVAPVEVKLTPLAPESYRAVLTIDPLSSLAAQRSSGAHSQEMWQYIKNLTLSLQQPELGSTLERACAVTMAAFGCQVMAVYRLNSANPSLVKMCCAGSGGWLPDVLGADLLMREKDLKIWQKSKLDVTITGFLQKAFVEGLEYLAWMPLGFQDATHGLAVLGGLQAPPAELEAAAPTLQANLSAALQIHTLIANQSKTLVELEKSQYLADSVKDVLRESIILLDIEMHIVDLNKAAVQSLGYNLLDVAGSPVSTILIGSSGLHLMLKKIKEDNKRVKAPVQLRSEGNAITDRLFRRSGNSFLANFQIITLVSQGNKTGYAIVIQDLSEIDEYRNRNNQLERQAAFGELTASFIHDLKSPVNSLKTGLQLLSESLPASSPFQNNVHRLQQNCDRLAEVMSKGLSFIRPNDYKMEAVHLDKLLKHLVNTTWQQRLFIHKVKSEFHSENKPMVIQGDAQALEHLFTNLFDNSVDAMRSNPPDSPRTLGISIRQVKTDHQTPQIEVKITDTGPGIPDSMRERIFDMFYTTKETGTGIGLAIVKSITTAHKGVVSVESFVGGSIFSIKFPAYVQNTQSIEIIT